MELTTRAKTIIRIAEFDPNVVRKWSEQDFAGLRNVGRHTADNLRRWLKTNPRKPRQPRAQRPSRRDELVIRFEGIMAGIGWIVPAAALDKLAEAAIEVLSKKKPRKRK